jgi:hypothetical protein
VRTPLAIEMVTIQGYDLLSALSELMDATIMDLISIIRKPGGTILDPSVLPIPALIPNPGINVCHQVVTNVKLSAFNARHYIRTLKPMYNPLAALAPNNIHQFIRLKE